MKRRKHFNRGVKILLLVTVFMCAYAIWWNVWSDLGDDAVQTLVGINDNPKMTGYCYHYSQLSDSQKKIYQTLYEGSRVFESRIKLPVSTKADCRRAWAAFRCDHPECFWLTDPKLWGTGNDIKKISFSIPKNAKEQQKAVEAVADAMLKDIPDDPYEKVKYIYKSIIMSTEYQKGTEHEQDIRSVLLSHKSVCGGYSKTFLYLCDRAGVPCGYIEGDIVGRDLHAWNFVKPEDQYYWVDVTWGDPSYEYFNPTTLVAADAISYDYLCVNDEFLLKDRILSNDPACSIYNKNSVFQYPSVKNPAPYAGR